MIDTMNIVKICHKHGHLKINDLNKSLRCKLCQREWVKNNYYKNKEKILMRQIEYTKNYRKNNPDKVKVYNKRYWKKSIDEINNNYVKDTIKRKSKLRNSEIPNDLIEAKKILIKIKRKIKEIESDK